MLTAQNVHGGYWGLQGDGKDGAGVIHGQDAVNFAANLYRIYPGNTGRPKGYADGSYSEWDFTNQNTKAYNITIPNPKPANKHLKIVFTWDSFPDAMEFTNRQNLLPDFDIVLWYNGSPIWYSSSWDSNNEIIEVDASDLIAGATYQIVVTPYTWRHPLHSVSDIGYYALAFDFVTNHAK